MSHLRLLGSLSYFSENVVALGIEAGPPDL
jgi:hypothetical protein